MFNRLKTAVVGAVEGFEIGKSPSGGNSNSASALNKHNLPHKHKYSRPTFLKLNEEKMTIAADRKIRPIINTSEELLNNAGYAECVNAGKSLYNEDQAVISEGVIRGSRPFDFRIPYHYYAVFDGHAGFGAALDASRQLHHIVNQKFLDMADDIFSTYLNPQKSMPLTRDTLIIGALESAFSDMDNVIAENRNRYYPAGGCTVLVAVFMLGRLYVANAGDSRAVLCTNGEPMNMSYDFTPVTDRLRIRMKGAENPSLLGNEFSCREYVKCPKPEDLGKTVLYREPTMTGWTYRTVDDTDLRKPVITGKGRRSRVMSTIGVTRGFGDHDLVCYAKKIAIKPFLSCAPEVLVHKIQDSVANQALVMATDGLWDVVTPKQAAKIVSISFENYESKNRWTAAATCLVSCARGSVAGVGTDVSSGGTWRMKNGRPASCDDISALIVPLAHYRAVELALHQEYAQQAQNHYRNIPITLSDVTNALEVNELRRQTENKREVAKDNLTKIVVSTASKGSMDEQVIIDGEEGEENDGLEADNSDVDEEDEVEMEMEMDDAAEADRLFGVLRLEGSGSPSPSAKLA